MRCLLPRSAQAGCQPLPDRTTNPVLNAANFYCIYNRRKPGELLYNVAHEGIYLNQFNVPDCTGWSSLLHRHAQQLVAAGVDYVAADMTNLVGCKSLRRTAFTQIKGFMTSDSLRCLLCSRDTTASQTVRAPCPRIGLCRAPSVCHFELDAYIDCTCMSIPAQVSS